MSLFNIGDFVLSSGRRSSFRIDCDALRVDDWKAIAELVRRLVGPFGSVEGVPRGGLILAALLRPHVTEGRHLIVDDVLTTGGSIIKCRYDYCTKTGRPHQEVFGVVVFQRGPCSKWVTSLFTLHPEAEA